MEYTKGSEWRIWDLHFHTPSSYDYKNRSVTNQQIVDKLIENNVSAVAITDHHRIDFARIKELNTIANNMIHFFRGIETTTNLGGNETVHIIAIFPDNVEEDIINRKFLYPLSLDEEAYEKKDLTSLQETYVDYNSFIKAAKECNALISVHAGHKSNSIENICNHFASKQKQKQDMLLDIDILETGNQKDLENYDKIVFPNINMRLPIIIGSDNHNVNSYNNPPTWIKADVTFEGLKQIKYEPQSRVNIKDFNPALSKTNTCLECLSILDTKMFNESKIEFNKGLVSIIGEKGSGKTALLDIISLAYGLNNRESSSFLLRAYDNLKNLSIASKNYSIDEVTHVDINHGLQIPNVEYISPISLAKYCEDKKEMQKFIENIIFDEEINNINEDLQNSKILINTNVEFLKALESSLVQTDFENEKYASLLQKIDKQKKLRPKIHKVSDELLKQYDNMMKELSSIDTELTNAKTKHNQHIQLENTIKENLRLKIEELKTDLIKEYDCVDFEKLDFKINFNVSSEFLNNLRTEADAIYKIKIELEKKHALYKEELEKIEKQIYSSQEAMKIYDKWKEELNQLNDEKKSSEQTLERLKREKAQYSDIIKSISQEYLKIIILKKRLLEKYKTLQSKLEQTIGNVGKTKIKLIASFNIEENEILNNLLEIINLKGLNEDDIKNNIRKHLVKHFTKMMNTDNADLKEEDVQELINILVNDKNESLLIKKDLSKKTSFKGMHDKYDLIKLALTDNFITINYTIQFNGMEISQLSTGQKGIVLLKLLLRLSNKTCPLLIDQPEDNLDNKSIFDELVQEFKSIKEKRQLIIATHNPNLVVNTDSEEVIIASYSNRRTDGYISYESGSLENPVIKDKVCNILEGGIEAFNKRQQKYCII